MNINRAEADIHIYTAPKKDQKPRQPFEPETVLVPAGQFLMGQPAADGIPEHETPEHTVTLSDFHIGSYPVTNRQYQAFVKAVAYKDVPAHWQLRQPPVAQLDYPVRGVSWEDARAYCAWLSVQTERRYRLPSEAEWEKAARGSRGRTYPWGEKWQDGLCNAASEHVTAVDVFPEGASEYGCEDLLGNVQEWTLTRWGPSPAYSAYPYPYDPTDGREDPDPGRGRSFRIHRGGCWKNRPEELRCSARGYSATSSRVPWRGFRVLLEAG